MYVDDNFHYGDEENRYKLGEFRTCEDARDACGHLVDDFLEGVLREAMDSNELYRIYALYGEDPFIVSQDGVCSFSAWDYARERCKKLCGEKVSFFS